MKCSKCGNKVSDTATFCKHCGTRLETDSDKKKPLREHIEKISNGKDKKIIIVSVVIILFIVYFFGFKCKVGLCLLPSSIKGDYCTLHTCNRSGCYNKVVEGKRYCYTHSPSTSTNHQYTPEKAEDVLTFSDIKISNNSSYTICNATITNNGKKTYTFVEVKGKFKDSSGNIIDTDWTYAVGTEGLAPGESATFRLSVSKNSNITKCDLEILDFNKE